MPRRQNFPAPIMDDDDEKAPVVSRDLVEWLEERFQRPTPQQALTLDGAILVATSSAGQVGREEVIGLLRVLAAR